MEFYWSFLFLAVAEGKITNLSQSLKYSDKGFLDTRKNQYASTSSHHTETGRLRAVSPHSKSKEKRGYSPSEKPVNSHIKNLPHAQSGTAMPFTQAVYPSAASKDSYVQHGKKALETNISSEVERG